MSVTEEQREEALRTAPLRKALAETEEARQQAQKAAERFKSIEESQARKLPLTPRQTLPGRQAEEVKQRKVPVSQLERVPEPAKKKEKKGRTLRDAIRERYGGGRPRSQSTFVKTSRGSQVYHQGRVSESSGRISTELNPQKAERLAILREKVRAVQNRRELHTLEKLYRRFRAQNTKDPELRP